MKLGICTILVVSILFHTIRETVFRQAVKDKLYSSEGLPLHGVLQGKYRNIIQNMEAENVEHPEHGKCGGGPLQGVEGSHLE